MGKRAQQEMAGFVIIIVLVVVAIFIFLVISFRDKEVKESSMLVESLSSSLIKHTTECVVQEPVPLDIGGLIVEAYVGVPRCLNIDKSTREYLNETIYDLMDKVLRSESRFNAYQIDILDKDGGGIGRYSKGQCSSGTPVKGEQIDLGKVKVQMIVCLNVDD
jgi:hypothetical protein